MIQYSLGGLFMIKEVKNVEDANKCDELLTKLILDERKYNDLIDDNIVIKNHFSKMLDDEDVILLAYYLDKLIVGYILIRKWMSSIHLWQEESTKVKRYR